MQVSSLPNNLSDHIPITPLVPLLQNWGKLRYYQVMAFLLSLAEPELLGAELLLSSLGAAVGSTDESAAIHLS